MRNFVNSHHVSPIKAIEILRDETDGEVLCFSDDFDVENE
jgi:hypothetical protein